MGFGESSVKVGGDEVPKWIEMGDVDLRACAVYSSSTAIIQTAVNRGCCWRR